MGTENLKLEVKLSMTEKILGPMKHVLGESKKVSAALKAAKDNLKDLNDTQKRIDGFRQTAKDAAITVNQLKAARSRLREVKRAMSETVTPSKELTRALKEAQQNVSTNSLKLHNLTDKYKRLKSELAGNGVNIKQLKAYQTELTGKIERATAAVDKETAAMQRQNKIASKLYAAKAQFAKPMEWSGRLRNAGMAAAGAGAAINAVGAIPVLAYAKAEDSATQLKIAMMQAGGVVSKEFEAINELANRLGNKLPGTTSDFQDMMTMLIRQGMPAKNVLGGLGEATAYLAVQLKMAPTDAAAFASKLQDATRTADKDMMGLMDTIQKTFYLGVDQGNMLQGFAKLSPALSIIKKDGVEAARMLAPLLVMTDQAGMVGEAAGNAYRKIFQMSLDAKKLAKGNAELHGTGIVLDFSNGKGEFGGLDKMYAQLEKLRGVDTQRRLAALKKIFGDDAETLQALSIMIEKGVGGYREVQARMEAQASLQERVNLQLGTLKNLWDAASGTFTNLLVAFGESISPELHATAEWMGQLAERAQSWAKANPELSGTLMTVVKWAGMLAVGVGGVLAAASAVLVPLAAVNFGLGVIGTSLGAVGRGIWAVIKGVGYMAGFVSGKIFMIGRVLLTNPIFLAAAALAGLAYLVYSNWDSIKKWWDGMWGGITNKFKLAWDEIKTWWVGIDFLEIGKNIMRGLADGIMSGFKWVKDALSWVAKLMPSTVNKELDIKSPSRVFAEIGGFTMDGLEQGILRGQDGPLGALAKAAKGITAAGADIQQRWPALNQTVGKDPVSHPVVLHEKLGQDALLGALAKAAKGITAAGAGMLVSGAAMAIPAIDTRPPLGMSQSAPGGGMPMIVQITINPSPGMDETAIARAVATELQRIEAQRAARGRSRLRDME